MIKFLFCLGVLALGLQTSQAFSLLGPLPTYPGVPANFGDAWQVPLIGYDLNGDIGGPKNIGEGYRINVPVIYYACDAGFYNYFGLTGATNIDAAFDILNAIPNVSSVNLNSYPFDVTVNNATARSLRLADIKSVTLGILVEHMGLADPTRYVDTLQTRYSDPNYTCPTNVYYLSLQRNFDPVTLTPSDFINGDLYTYTIFENCGNASFNPPPDAYTVTANSAGNIDNPVSSRGIARQGDFYTGLTYDDVGGLKYLLSSNNVVLEDVLATGNNFKTTLVSTNIGSPVPLITSDLGALIADSKIYDPATLMVLHPGLVAYGLATNYSVGWITNYSASYSIPNGSPYGTAPQLVIVPTATPTIITSYVTAFANVVTNHYYPNTVTVQTTVSVGQQSGTPYPTIALATTTTTQQVVLTNTPSGDYYLLPTNVWGYNVLSVLLTNPVITSNVIISVNDTNTGYYYNQSQLVYSTNYWLLVQPLNQSFPTPVAAIRQGVEHVQYVRTAYDSLLGQTFTPITNTYTMVKMVNFKPVTEFYQRILTGPDIVFSGTVLNSNPAADPNNGVFILTRSGNIFDVSQIYNGLSGPGVITPATKISLDTSGLYYYSSSGTKPVSTNFTIVTNVSTRFVGVQWASYNDVTPTNIVVYPNGNSVASLQAAQSLQLSPAILPNATNGTFYSQSFTATGGVPPFTWSSPDISANVPGLTLSSSGVLSGTPIVSVTTNFTVIVNFLQNQTVKWIYPLTVQ